MPDEPEVVVTDRGPGEDLPVLRPMPWYAMILIRVFRTYIQGLLGFLAAGMVGSPNVRDFGVVLLSAASLAVAPAVVALLMNSAEILAKWDQTQPQIRA